MLSQNRFRSSWKLELWNPFGPARMRVGFVVIAIALFLAFSPMHSRLGLFGDVAPVQAAAPAEVPPTILGLDDRGSIANQPTGISLAQAVGASWVRTSISWSAVEPVAGVFNWAGVNAQLGSLTSAGFSPAVYITDNPAWASSTPCGPIDTTSTSKVAAFSTFMQNLAAQYPQVKHWALYNEVDNADYPTYTSGGCFGDHVTNDINSNGRNDRADYAEMLAAAWKGVHLGNPAAQLAMGAVAFDSFDSETCPASYPGHCDPVTHSEGHFNSYFLSQLFAYMHAHPRPSGEQYMDLALYNYYDIYGPWWESQASGKGIQAKANALRKKMAAYGFNWPLFVSETGESSADVGMDGQSRCVALSMVRGMAARLRGVIWWTFRDDVASSWYYGLLDTSFAPKPSYTAYQVLSKQLAGYTYKKNLTNTTGFGGIEAHRFTNGTGLKTVLWSATPTDPKKKSLLCSSDRLTVRASFGPGARVLQVVDLYGHTRNIRDGARVDKDPRVGYIGLRIGALPNYVVVNP